MRLEHVCRLRAATGLSLTRLAQLIGCHRMTIWRWEHGIYPISPRRIIQIATLVHTLRRQGTKAGNQPHT